MECSGRLFRSLLPSLSRFSSLFWIFRRSWFGSIKSLSPFSLKILNSRFKNFNNFWKISVLWWNVNFHSCEFIDLLNSKSKNLRIFLFFMLNCWSCFFLLLFLLILSLSFPSCWLNLFVFWLSINLNFASFLFFKQSIFSKLFHYFIYFFCLCLILWSFISSYLTITEINERLDLINVVLIWIWKQCSF